MSVLGEALARGAAREIDGTITYVDMDGRPFEYDPWRHGGWYTSVRYPSGACGCVSRNYADRKWRIACDSRPGDYTYRSRGEAARAEAELVAEGVLA